MEIEVPTPFLQYLRRQQIAWMFGRISFLLLLGLFLIEVFPSFGVGGLTGGLGVALIPLGVLLLSGHSAIRYHLHSDGIGLTASRFGPGLITGAYQYAFFWRRDPLVSMEYSHWQGAPALLLKTAKRPHGFLLPLAREDLEAVIEFLRPLVFVPSPTPAMTQVACLGILVADVVGKPIEAFPPKGTLSAVARIELHPGGCAANTGIALAKLGIDVAVMGKVGQDGFGDFLASILMKNGVSTQGFMRSVTEATAATMVAVDADGERTFLHYAGANTDYTAADVAWGVIDAAPILHIAGPFLMPNFIGTDCAVVLKRAKELGKITTLDTVWDSTDRWMSVLEPSLPFLDYALPSLEEARRLTGYDTPQDIAQVFLDKGVRVVGLKMGAEGAYLRAVTGEEITMPPFDVPVVDALGAGDAWVAGYLCGLTHGWDWERSLRFANAAGACCIQSLGATSGVRSFAETSAMAFGSVTDTIIGSRGA